MGHLRMDTDRPGLTVRSERDKLSKTLESTSVFQPVAAILPENADRVTQLARWGKGSVEEIAYAPD